MLEKNLCKALLIEKEVSMLEKSFLGCFCSENAEQSDCNKLHNEAMFKHSKIHLKSTACC